MSDSHDSRLTVHEKTMNDAILKSLCRRVGLPDLLQTLTERMSLTELNSLLMAVFDRRVQKITPAELLKNYIRNPYVHPSGIDPVPFKQWEVTILQQAAEKGYAPLELSPISPLGSCSVVGTVSQDKVLSATRHTEVVADATNVMALESSRLRKSAGFDPNPLRFCTVHRHTRAPRVSIQGFTQHFKVFCLTTAGRDTGSYAFELKMLQEHISVYLEFLKKEHIEGLKITLKSLDNPGEKNILTEKAYADLSGLASYPVEVIPALQAEQNYYRGLQFKIFIIIDGQGYDIGDGGFVDSTQQLTGNRKERFLISALGLEFLWKMRAESWKTEDGRIKRDDG